LKEVKHSSLSGAPFSESNIKDFESDRRKVDKYLRMNTERLFCFCVLGD